MPVIPRSTRQVAPNPVSTPEIRTSPGEITGRAIQQLGEGASKLSAGLVHLSDELRGERDKLDDFQTRTALARFHAEQDQKQIEYDANVRGDGRDHTLRRLQLFDADREAVLNGLPNNEKARRLATLQLETLRGHYGTASHRRQIEHLGIYAASETERTIIGSFVPRVTADLRSVEDNLRAADAAIDATPNINERVKEKLREEAAKAMAKRWIELAGPDAADKANEVINRFISSRPTTNGVPPEARLGKAPEVKDAYVAPPVTVQFPGTPSAGTWNTAPAWKALDKYQKAALMSLLEADARNGVVDMDSARNALGAMINRADKEKKDLGDHVSQHRTYQPLIEPTQYARAARLIQSPEFQQLTQLAYARDNGKVDDWVGGATHFLAHERVMLALERGNPAKYRSWKGWSGFDANTGQYRDVALRDASHAFVAPEGRHSKGGPTPAATAPASDDPFMMANAEPQGLPKGAPMRGMDHFASVLLSQQGHINKLAADRQKEITAAARTDGFLSGELMFNPHSADDRKLVDDAFSRPQDMERLMSGDKAMLARVVQASQQLNYVPKPLVDAVSGLVFQNDPAKRAIGLETAASILQRQPHALLEVKDGARLKKKAEEYAALVSVRGMTPEAAVARLDEIETPEWEKLSAGRAKEAKEKADSYAIGNVLDGFDTSSLPFYGQPGLSTADKAAGLDVILLQQFREAYRDNYVRHGDDKVARDLAIKELKAQYGRSDVAGNNTLMRYPPEQFYRPVGGSHDYLRVDLMKSVKEAIGGKDVPADRIFLRADSQTQRDIQRDGRPSYQVLWVDDRGVIQAPIQGRWRPDLEFANKSFTEKFEKERAKAATPEALQFEADRNLAKQHAPHLYLRAGAQKLWGWLGGE